MMAIGEVIIIQIKLQLSKSCHFFRELERKDGFFLPVRRKSTMFHTHRGKVI